jgi:hypothetical protein
MTKIINFSDLVTPPKMAIVIGDVTHEMAEATIQTFIDQSVLVQKLGDNPDPIKEAEAYIQVVSRAFPTIPAKDIRNWTMSQVMAVMQMVNSTNGQIVTDDEAEATSGNVQPAA